MIKEVKLMTVRETGPVGDSVQKPETLVRIWRESVQLAQWYDPEKEAFVVFLLDRKNRVKGWHLVSLGTVDASLVHPREVFRAACVASAASVIVAHHHPSGDPSPSAEDVKITRQLVAAGQVLGIPVLDHVVIGEESVFPPGYMSMRDKGYLNFTDN
jgi:DNA repair protein RadC